MFVASCDRIASLSANNVAASVRKNELHVLMGKFHPEKAEKYSSEERKLHSLSY